MLMAISIPWYEMSCSYGTAIDIIPKTYGSLQLKGHREVIIYNERNTN